ncbi:MAG: acyl-CoA thioesterase [Gammaproteobacteria bacterium]|nr:acyl-CoA thioesterase [Gammaproteobacteria bacterium]
MKSITIEHRVDWIYCDPAGIMFYPSYYVWFDQATERLFAGNGLSYEEVRKKYNVIGYPLVETGAKYKTPCRHGETVSLHSHVEEWAGKTFVVRHRIVHSDGREALEGFERRVWAVLDPTAPQGMRAAIVPKGVCDLFVD